MFATVLLAWRIKIPSLSNIRLQCYVRLTLLVVKVQVLKKTPGSPVPHPWYSSRASEAVVGRRLLCWHEAASSRIALPFPP
jgi:hypothetical protein